MNRVKERKPFAERLKQGLEEGIQFAKGELELKTITLVSPELAPDVKPADVMRIRRKLNMSRLEFAKTLNVSAKTLRGWENGEQKPTGPARRLLQLIGSEPGLVFKALTSSSRERAKRQPAFEKHDK